MGIKTFNGLPLQLKSIENFKIFKGSYEHSNEPLGSLKF
jgi:hypothetical protein